MTRVKNLKWLIITTILVMVTISCQKENPQAITQNVPVVTEKGSPGLCDVITDLIAGQHTDVGEVIVTHDLLNIYVTYVISEPGWCITETHMHVAAEASGIPQTKKGNPKVGHFEYSGQHDCITEYTYTVPIQWNAGVEVVVAAHAVVKNDNSSGTKASKGKPISNEPSHETAWGAGVPFPGNNWAMYFYYTLCYEGGGGIGTESEPAYAFAPDGSGIGSPCFPTIPLQSEHGWGWLIGPYVENFSFELWALPSTCSHQLGFHVGYVEVQFKNGGKMDVSFRCFLGYSLQDVSLWVGSSPWSPAMGEIKPYEFPYKETNLGGAVIYTLYDVEYSGPVYMIGYALVYGVIHIG